MAQAFGDALEQQIARLVAEAVIYVLEVVQVQEHYPHDTLVAPGVNQHLLQAVVEQGAVGQAGQGVVMRDKGQVVLGRPALADFLEQLARERRDLPAQQQHAAERQRQEHQQQLLKPDQDRRVQLRARHADRHAQPQILDRTVGRDRPPVFTVKAVADAEPAVERQAHGMRFPLAASRPRARAEIVGAAGEAQQLFLLPRANLRYAGFACISGGGEKLIYLRQGDVHAQIGAPWFRRPHG